MKGIGHKDLSGFAHTAGLLQCDSFFLHHLLDRKRVVECSINRAFVRLEGVTKTHAENVTPADDANKLVTFNDRHVMNTVFLHQSTDLGDRIAVMHGDHVTSHKVRDRVVSFHGGEITMKRLPKTSPPCLAMRGRMLRQSVGQ